MSLADDLKQANQAHEKHCTIRRIVGAVDDETRDELLAALTNGALSNTRLTVILRSNGHSLGEHAVRDHRDGKCPCARSKP